MTIVISNGQIHALAGGPLSIADMGKRSTRRVSTIEFADTKQRWEVRAPNGKLLGEFDNYDDALAWERDHFNQNLVCIV